MTFCGQIILLKSETWNRIQWVGNLIAAAQATYKSSIYQYLSVQVLWPRIKGTKTPYLLALHSKHTASFAG